MKKYNNIIKALYGTIWAIMPEKLEAIVQFIDIKSDGGYITEKSVQEIKAARPTRKTSSDKSIAVIPLHGVISQRMNIMSDISGGTSTESFAKEFDLALADNSVASILIDIDSPGGAISGVPELSKKIYDARGVKPVVAIANSLAASAAIWIGSSADEFYVTPSGEVGSVGVYAMHTDYSEADANDGIKHTFVSAGKHKVDGNPYEPLSDEAKSDLQERVNEIHTDFLGDMKRNRGNIKAASDNFGEGKVFGATKAFELGLVDGVTTYEQLLKDMGVKSTSNKVSMKRARAAVASFDTLFI